MPAAPRYSRRLARQVDGATPKDACSLVEHRREFRGRGAFDGHSLVAIPRTRGIAIKNPLRVAVTTISRANPHHDTAGTVEKWYVPQASASPGGCSAIERTVAATTSAGEGVPT